jgi:hypothetical protein
MVVLPRINAAVEVISAFWLNQKSSIDYVSQNNVENTVQIICT